MAKKIKPTSVSSYFRNLFQDHPDWLKLSDNTQVREQWKKDHGGQAMSKTEEGSMANMKSQMRKTLRVTPTVPRGKGKKKSNPRSTSQPVSPRQAVDKLERLEVMIDDCLSAARIMNIDALDPVIKHLRLARNNIVLMFDVKS